MWNGTSQLTSVLLDKSVVREALRALQRGSDRLALPERQYYSLAAINAALEQGIVLCITTSVLHILGRLDSLPVSAVFLPRLRVLAHSRYLKRWARRLREEGFSREDAEIVSHASFGVNDATGMLGVEAFLTTDYALKRRYERNIARLSQRFERMTCQLGLPFRDATLPIVFRPDELLGVLLR